MTDTAAILAWPPPALIAAELGRRLRLVARRMNGVIQRQGFPPAFLVYLRQALREPGKLLVTRAAAGKPVVEGDQRLWALPVVLAHAAVSGTDLPDAPMATWRDVAPAAAAAEFLGVALDIIDDIQDGDGALVQELGIPIALNVALALLGLTHAALADPQSPAEQRGPLHEIFATDLLTATGGQFLDLAFEERSHISMASAVEMTERKSGALVALTYRAGATIGVHATTNDQRARQQIIEDFTAFGRAMGVRMQIFNDWRDAQADRADQKTDRARHKKTPPLVIEAEFRASGLDDPEALAFAVAQAVNIATQVQMSYAQQALQRLATSQHISTRWLQWLVSEQQG